MLTVLGDIERLMAVDVETTDPAELVELGGVATRVRSWLDAFDTRLVRRMSEAAPARDAAEPLQHRGRRETNAIKDRAVTTEHVPQMGEALADGVITTGHVDALTRASNALDGAGREKLAERGEQLAQDAASMSPEQFARHCHQLARHLAHDDGVSRHEHLRRQRHVHRWICRETGLHKTLIAVDALTDAKLWNVLGAVVDTARNAKQDDDTPFAHLQCDAIVEHIVTGRTDGATERVAEVTLLVDLATLLDGLHDESVCETSDGAELPVDTVRRLCCDAFIVPAVLGTDGELLDLGRSTRLANRAQRRALRAMYRTCGLPDCQVPFDRCRIHHVVFWEHGGTSNFANLLPLCEQHHHLLHEGGWHLSMTANRVVRLYRPDGTLAHRGATTDRCTKPTTTGGGKGPPHPLRPLLTDDDLTRLTRARVDALCRQWVRNPARDQPHTLWRP